jgi:asparagine synthase (glutamine-hydrolysing)
MCGISGYFSIVQHDGQAFASRANKLLSHRGPDGGNWWSNGFLTLSHVRLSIIDRSAAGNQPLSYLGNRFRIVFNGEIYNYVELKRELESLGHVFKTKTDTEVIPAAYIEWGDAFLGRLRGAFAFALWDQHEEQLLLARDRLGEKPLFYMKSEDGFLFASEFVALFHLGGQPIELRPDAVDLFFHYGYLPECSEWTSNIQRLKAGSFFKIRRDQALRPVEKYWDFRVDEKIKLSPADQLKAEFETISDIILRSDVPVGVALSGGIDSSAIAALAAKRIPERLHAFTVGYPGNLECDERAHASELANILGIRFHEVLVTEEEVVEGFPELVRARNEPFVDIAGFGYLRLFKAAREAGVPVMLLGQGGDELFWGYSFLSLAAFATARHKKLRRSPFFGFSDYLLRHDAQDQSTFHERWRKYLNDRRTPFEFVHMMEFTPDFQSMQQNRRSIFTENFLREVNYNNAFEPLRVPQDSTMSADQLVVRAICSTYLRENGMAQSDRLAMSAGIEVRLPFSDYRLAELSLALKGKNSDRFLEPKYWLKQLTRPLLPPKVFSRPKRGFAPPVEKWVTRIFESYGHWLKDGHLVAEGILRPQIAECWSKGTFEWDGVFPAPLKALSLEAWLKFLHKEI